MTDHYNGSKGPVLIASMAHKHLRSARDKLIRDGFEKERAAEVEAMTARLAVLDAEYAEAEAAKAADPEPAPFVDRAEIVF